MKKLLSNGVDPGEYRKTCQQHKQAQAANSFEAIAREWFAKHQPNWSTSNANKIIRRLERDIFPWIGKEPITAITPIKLLGVVRKVEERGAIETAHRVLSYCRKVFRYAVVTARAERDITTDLQGALSPPPKTKHFASMVEPEAVGKLLQAIEGYQGTLVVKSALKIAPLVFVRPKELRTAQWCDINFDTAEWRYLVTKTQTEHIVPLATQSLAILKELYPLTGQGQYVFPSARGQSKPMSDNAILAALRTLGIEKEQMSGHGFRAMARTILDEVLKVRPDYIEHQLAHAVRDPNGRAYNRTKYLPERKTMMQQWANYLGELKNKA